MEFQLSYKFNIYLLHCNGTQLTISYLLLKFYL